MVMIQLETSYETVTDAASHVLNNHVRRRILWFVDKMLICFRRVQLLASLKTVQRII